MVFLSFAPSSRGHFSFLIFVKSVCVHRPWVQVFLVAFVCGLLPIDMRWQDPCCCCFLAAVSHMDSGKGGECNYLFPLFGFPGGYYMAMDYSACLPPIITVHSACSFRGACIGG